MKKSSVIILITSVCLILIGAILAGITGTVGGVQKIQELIDEEDIAFEVPFFEEYELQLDSTGLYFAPEDDMEQVPSEVYVVEPSNFEATVSGSDAPKPSENVEEMVDAIENIASLEIKLGAGELEFRKSGDDRIHIQQDGNLAITPKTDGDKLVLEVESRVNVQIFGVSVGDSVAAGCATLYLPDRVYDEISIEMGAGTCNGDFPESRQLSIDMGAGEVEFAYVKTGEFELRVGAGECSIDTIEADKINADIAMGEFSAKARIHDELDAKVGMGEISMDIIGEENDFDYDVEVGAGEVTIGSRSYSGVGSGGGQSNNTGKEIDVECGMGEAIIRFVEG